MMKILKIVGCVLIAVFVVVCACFAYLMFLFSPPSKCSVSKEAYYTISQVLTPTEQATLKREATEGDADVECSLWFTYVRDGRAIEVDARADAIHGTKYGSSDDGGTAKAIYRQRHQ